MAGEEKEGGGGARGARLGPPAANCCRRCVARIHKQTTKKNPTTFLGGAAVTSQRVLKQHHRKCPRAPRTSSDRFITGRACWLLNISSLQLFKQSLKSLAAHAESASWCLFSENLHFWHHNFVPVAFMFVCFSASSSALFALKGPMFSG